MKKYAIDKAATGQNIQKILENSEYDNKTLLKIIHTQSKTVKKWCSGESLPTTRQIFAIAFVGNCNVEDIVVKQDSTK